MKPKVYPKAGEVNQELVCGCCGENVVVEMLNAVRLFGYLFWLLAFGYWLLVVGFWLLAISY